MEAEAVLTLIHAGGGEKEKLRQIWRIFVSEAAKRRNETQQMRSSNQELLLNVELLG